MELKKSVKIFVGPVNKKSCHFEKIPYHQKPDTESPDPDSKRNFDPDSMNVDQITLISYAIMFYPFLCEIICLFLNVTIRGIGYLLVRDHGFLDPNV